MSHTGFLCPQCQAWTRVLDTRTPYRRRECANGHRFKTEEKAIDSPSDDEPPYRAHLSNYATSRRKTYGEDS